MSVAKIKRNTVNVCVSEMAPYGAFSGFIEGCISFTAVAEMEISPQCERVCRGETWSFQRFLDVFLCSVWFAIIAARICPESWVWVCSAPGIGPGRDSVFHVCALLS